jgi:hypothetical protein
MIPGRILREFLSGVKLSFSVIGKLCNLTALTALALACITIGCAGTSVIERKTYAENERLPKPHRIIVYDFAATPADLPADDLILALYEKPAKHQTADKIKLGRTLGAEIAGELVNGIHNLGLPAERSKTGRPPRIGDLVIRGAFMSVEEGSRLKRVLIGFGAGAGELKTLVEIYQITARGSRALISEEIKATGGKMPGMLFAVVAAVGAGPAGLAVSPAAAAGTTGSVAEATAVSGGVNTAKELGPESLEAAAKRTAKEITKALSKIFAQHGWIR